MQWIREQKFKESIGRDELTVGFGNEIQERNSLLYSSSGILVVNGYSTTSFEHYSTEIARKRIHRNKMGVKQKQMIGQLCN